jgi:hypothetical protein
VCTSLVGVGGEGFVSVEVQVALEGEAEWATEIAQFVHAHESEFRRSHAEVAKTEGDVIEPEFGEDFCRNSGMSEEGWAVDRATDGRIPQDIWSLSPRRRRARLAGPQ